MVLTVILEKVENNWGAYTPDDIGSVLATGDTREETIENFRGALKSHLAAMKRNGLTAPVIEGLKVQELMPV